MFDPLERVAVGDTGVRVSRIGFGGAHFAPAPGRDEPLEPAAMVRAAFEQGVRYFDTAPLYSLGESERYLGDVLLGVPRDEIVVSTKVGRILDDSRRGWHFDFSRDAVLRSLEASLRRLGLDRVDILYIHDADEHWEQAISEAFPALAELRAQGVVKAIGAGMNQWEMELRFAKEGDFDVFLLAGRYTLLEQTSAAEFLPYCQERGIGVVVGGPYNSGILASDLDAPANYNYRPAPPEVLERARRLKGICDRHRVSLKAAALRFVLAHPAVVSAIPGPRTVGEVAENLALAAAPIPAALWDELKREGLLAADAPVPA